MRKYIFILFALTTALSSCVSYDAEEFTGKTLPRVTGYTTGITNDWLYINLRTGKIFNLDKPNGDIKEGEQRERTDWDIAFCGYRMRTNRAADLGYGSYDTWKTVAQLPTNLQWVVDDHSVYITMSQNDWNKYLIANKLDFEQNPWFDPNRGPASTQTDANPILAKAMTFTGPPPVYAPSFHTYVVRTADGERYFKLQIISWYKADVEIGDTGGQMSYYCDELR